MGNRDTFHDLIAPAAACIFLFDADGRILDVSDHACATYGYTRTELFEMNVADLDPGFVEWKSVHMGDVEGDDGCVVFESEHLTKDGVSLPVEVRLSSVQHGNEPTFLGVFHDIGERKSAEEALGRMRTHFANMVERNPDAVLVVDGDHTICFANEMAEVLFGRKRAELVGLPFGFSLRDDAATEVELISKDHRVTYGELRVIPSQWQGRPATLVMMRDVTERKKAEQRQRELEAQLRQSHKMEAIGTLAGGVAHDFNNILGIILGNIELAADDLAEADPARLSLTEARQACLRARDVVKQILTFSRQEEKAHRPSDIRPIVKEALKMLRSAIPTTVELRQDISVEKAVVMGNATQIQQVLMNLCTNGVHAMEPGGGLLEIRLAAVELDEEGVRGVPELMPGPHIRLTVSDNGAGMSPEVLNKVFDPYFTTKGVGKGTGMGLAVAHGIVRDHGGAITAYSEPGKGTTFHVFFPQLALRGETVEDGPAVLPKGKETVLFVDDEVALASLGGKMLTSLDYHVESRTSSVEALEAFKANPGKFDLIITDMTMPNMTGDVLAREVMQIRDDIPVVLCTGFSHAMDEAKAAAMGIKGFVMKPLVRSELAKTVRRVLDEGETKRPQKREGPRRESSWRAS